MIKVLICSRLSAPGGAEDEASLGKMEDLLADLAHRTPESALHITPE